MDICYVIIIKLLLILKRKAFVVLECISTRGFDYCYYMLLGYENPHK